MARVGTKCSRCGATLPETDAGAAGACPQCGEAATAAPKGRRGRSAILAAVALAAIVVAGVVIYLNFPDDLLRAAVPARPAAAAPPAKREVSDAPDKAEIRTRLVVARVGKDGAAKAVVALGRPAGPKTPQDASGTRQGILLRELVRQALLIAARDELGLATRDESLDDIAPPAAEGQAVELATLFRPGGTRAMLRRVGGEGAGVVLKVDLGDDPDNGNYPLRLAKQAEGMSRSEFVAALKGLGAEGTANEVRDAAPVPAKVEERLSGLGLVEHVAAIRDLHAAIRADGESPERLGALARAYAQLGVLTEFQCSPAHKAFKARAILYAERLRAREPGSSRARWNRAFVWALTGLPAEALDTLDEMKADAAKGGEAPPWGPVLEAYVKGDLKRLKEERGPHAKLAVLLRMLAVEFPQNTRAAVLAARDVLSADADCYRAYDVICASGGLGDRHVATEAGPAAFTRLFPVKLRSVGSLPSGVRESLDKADEPGAVAALAKAGAPGEDAGEPSWGSFAHLARETRFAQVARRLYFMRYAWAVPVDDYWAEVRPSVADHRDLPYLEAMALPPRELARSVPRDLDLTDLEVSQNDLIKAMRAARHPATDSAWTMAFFHSDTVVRDISEVISNWQDRRAHFGRNLLLTSPYNAFAMATLIESDWDHVKGDAPAWREKVGDAPALLLALGKREAMDKRLDEAAKLLARSVELSPDREAYQALAACYEAKGDIDRWKATLDEYLTKTEDAGLDHARVRVQIANDYMSRGQFAEAKPYAEAAAQTWAGWAMTCAAHCAEGSGDLDQAELWTQRTTERYPTTSWTNWYSFCKRTGHGDLKAARAWTDAYVASVAGRPDLADPETVGYYYWSVGSPKEAHDALTRAFDVKPTAPVGINLAVLADELGDKARRDSALAKVCDELKDQAPKSAAICRLIRDSLADGGKTPLDLKAIDAILESIPAERRPGTEFFIGKYLMNHGKTDVGRKYLKHCADSPTLGLWFKTIAEATLKAPDPPKEL
ncbi:MAG TPA: hypothetical protein VG406_15475 [Isosphaeraceae bacterium]|nr:hypothetical protein [Isosphaeraceae bacterium]